MAGAEGEGDRLKALSQARRDAYVVLSCAFTEPPTSQSLAALENDTLLKEAEEGLQFGGVEPSRRCSATAEHAVLSQDQARQEFMNLFKVPGGQYITPYESVFRDSHDVAGKQVKGLLMGQSAVAVQQWYKLAAVEISDAFKDLPDHIGLELNFLAHLCGKELVFTAANDEAKLTRTWEMERDFLAAHVVSWVTQLRDKLYEKSQHAYFRKLADLLVEFTKRDLATLEEVVGPSTGKPSPEYEAIA